MTDKDGSNRQGDLPTEGHAAAVVALPGYYQRIADDIIASDDPMRCALIYLLNTFTCYGYPYKRRRTQG
jgi:hypothetical protein